MTDLCLAVIAKNESRSITRCLESAKHLVDRSIVLDTGSTDNTIDLAEAAGAVVHRGTWADCFSTARNQCMHLAKADWCLVLDADEWIAPGMTRDILEAHIQRVSRKTVAGAVKVRNLIYLDGRHEFADSWLPRLLPGSTRYKGRVHEQPVTCEPDYRLNFLIYHDGYVKKVDPDKQKRNTDLLIRALEDNPSSAYLHYQLAVQYEIAAHWQASVVHLLKSLDLGADNQPFSHNLHGRLMHAFARCKRLDEAINLGSTALSRWPASVDIHFIFGNICLDKAQERPAEALALWLPNAEHAWLKCLELGRFSAGSGEILGRGRHLAAHNLATMYECLGNSNQAGYYRKLATRMQKDFHSEILKCGVERITDRGAVNYQTPETHWQ